jgi:hypothetical protein
MKHLLVLLAVIFTACGGSLSDEQRRKLHDGMEDQKIVKVSDAEIVTASLEQGRTIYKALENVNFNSAQVDSIAEKYHVSIRLMTPGASDALEVENQLIEAYVAGAATGSVQDNIQKIHSASDPKSYDSLLYSRPKVLPLPDGAVKVEGIWNIHLAKKNVVRMIGSK